MLKVLLDYMSTMQTLYTNDVQNDRSNQQNLLRSQN